MPTAQWPSPLFGGGNLPDFIPKGAKRGTPKEGKIVDDFEVGPPYSRPRSTAIVESLDFVLLLKTDALMRELRDFHDVTLNQGTDIFEWVLPEDPGTLPAGPFNLRDFQFQKRPAYTWVEKPELWEVSISLIVRP